VEETDTPSSSRSRTGLEKGAFGTLAGNCPKTQWNMQPEAADGEGDVSRSSAHLLRINGRDNPIPWENA
jgi:hypothetical protein